MKWFKRFALGIVKPIVLAAVSAGLSEVIDEIKGEIKDPRLRAGADAAMTQLAVRGVSRIEDALDKAL